MTRLYDHPRGSRALTDRVIRLRPDPRDLVAERPDAPFLRDEQLVQDADERRHGNLLATIETLERQLEWWQTTAVVVLLLAAVGWAGWL